MAFWIRRFRMKRFRERRFRILRVNTTSGQNSKNPIKLTGSVLRLLRHYQLTGLSRHLVMKML